MSQPCARCRTATTRWPIQSALIDDAQTTVVVVTGMDALDALGQQGDNISVTTDIVVITTLTIFGLTAGYQILDAEGTVALVSHAVDDEQLHGVMFQWFHNELFRVATLKINQKSISKSIKNLRIRELKNFLSDFREILSVATRERSCL